MPIEQIRTQQNAAIAAYTSGQAEGKTRSQARKGQAAPSTDGNAQSDQVTLSAQAIQQQTPTGTPNQLNQTREAENPGEDRRERNREEVAAGSKSVDQALNAYRANQATSA